MEELKISKANALRAFGAADKKGKQLLQDLFGKEVLGDKITDRVKSYEDACLVDNLQPVTIENFSFLAECDRESALAHHQMTIIARVLNEDWTPDWDNGNEYKYYPYFIWGGSGLGFSFCAGGCGRSGTDVGSRLVFKSRELAEYAGKQFITIYNQLFLIK
jgi:hypothetical protein